MAYRDRIQEAAKVVAKVVLNPLEVLQGSLEILERVGPVVSVLEILIRP